MSELNEFYLNNSEPNKSCLLTLRQILLDYDAGVSETKKYNMPCFIYNKKAICYLWIEKETKHPYILFVDGNKLEHCELEVGNRARMKILRINPTKDIPVNTIQIVFGDAINLIPQCGRIFPAACCEKI